MVLLKIWKRAFKYNTILHIFQYMLVCLFLLSAWVQDNLEKKKKKRQQMEASILPSLFIKAKVEVGWEASEFHDA